MSKGHDKYLEEHSDQSDVAVQNKAQHKLAKSLAPFFDALHTELKHLDRVVRAHQNYKTDQAKADGKRFSVDHHMKQLIGDA